VFGSEAWAYIPDKKWKALQPKSDKCIFVGYYKDVRGYRLIQPHSNEIIIRRDVNFDESLLTCKPILMFVPSSSHDPSLRFVPSSSCNPSLVSVPYSIPHFCYNDLNLVYSLDYDSEDENPPLPTHLPPIGFIEHEPPVAQQLPKWTLTT
jgi:hypothetical protein